MIQLLGGAFADGKGTIGFGKTLIEKLHLAGIWPKTFWSQVLVCRPMLMTQPNISSVLVDLEGTYPQAA